DAAVSRIHAGKAARSGAANEAEQHRFRLIVARVPDTHQVGTARTARPLEERVARGARRVLDRSPLARCAGGNVLAVNQRREAERGGQRGNEALVAIGGGAKAMVEMNESGQAQLAGAVEVGENVDERRRVRSAGDGGDDATLRPDQVVLPNELADACDEIHDHSLRVTCSRSGVRLRATRFDATKSGAGGRTRT